MNKITLLISLLLFSYILFSQTTEAELCNWAQEKIKNNQNEEALKVLKKAFKKNKKSAWAYSISSIAKSNLGDYKSALKDLDKAIKIDPSYADAYYNKGYIKGYDLGNYKEAIKEFSKAIELNPDVDRFYYHRGNSKHVIEDYIGALPDYNKAIDLNPSMPFQYTSRAAVLTELNQLENALRDCDMALKLDSTYSVAYAQKGLIYSKLGDKIKSCENLQKSVDLGNAFGKSIYKDFCK